MLEPATRLLEPQHWMHNFEGYLASYQRQILISHWDGPYDFLVSYRVPVIGFMFLRIDGSIGKWRSSYSRC